MPDTGAYPRNLIISLVLAIEARVLPLSVVNLSMSFLSVLIRVSQLKGRPDSKPRSCWRCLRHPRCEHSADGERDYQGRHRTGLSTRCVGQSANVAEQDIHFDLPVLIVARHVIDRDTTAARALLRVLYFVIMTD